MREIMLDMLRSIVMEAYPKISRKRRERLVQKYTAYYIGRRLNG